MADTVCVTMTSRAVHLSWWMQDVVLFTKQRLISDNDELSIVIFWLSITLARALASAVAGCDILTAVVGTKWCCCHKAADAKNYSGIGISRRTWHTHYVASTGVKTASEETKMNKNRHL